MIIALPTRDGNIDDHFGHCDHYTLMTLDDAKRIVKTETMDSPEGCGCKSDIAPILAGKGVKVMLAGNMGQGAVGDVAVQWIAGDIRDSLITCDHHDCGSHGDGHNHGHGLKPL